jgi:hypothetical protein
MMAMTSSVVNRQIIWDAADVPVQFAPKSNYSPSSCDRA